MIDVKEAVRKAVEYCADLYQDKKLELEEVELTEDCRFWLITLSYKELDFSKKTSVAEDVAKIFVTPPLHKEYKTFKINSENGEVLSMKIRKLA